MNENEVSMKLVKCLNSLPECYAKKRHSGKFQSGDPDIVGVYRGKAFYMETKMYPGGQLSLLQANCLDLLHAAKAMTFVIVYAPSAKDFLVYQVDPGDQEHAWLEIAKQGIVANFTTPPTTVIHGFDAEAWEELLR